MPNKKNKMKRRNLIIFCICFVSILFSCESNSYEKGVELTSTNSIVSRIDSIANSYLNSNKIVGFSIAVLQDREILYSKGFGKSDIENDKSVTAETIFPMASISKLITSIATMKLVEEGKLSLENTLFEVMPDFPRPDQAKSIQIRDLLSHTSGLADYAKYGDSLFVQENIFPKKDEYYYFFENNELLFTPGSKFSYSNSGFLLMGLIIEKITGNLYEDFIEQTISKPFKLSSLKHLNRNKENGTSIRYDLSDSTFVRSMMDTVYYFKGDGGMSATATDLARIPFELVDGNILSEKSIKAMMLPTHFEDESISDYGLGIRNGEFAGYKVWGHTGGHSNYWSTLAYYPEKRLSIVVFGNTDYSPVDALLIEGKVALVALNEIETNLEAQESKQTDLSIYTGEYSNFKEYMSPDDAQIIQSNKEDNNRLYRRYKNSTSTGMKLYYLGNHTFAPENYPMDRIVFDINKAGKVVGLRDYYNGLYMQMGKKIN
jgi:CubicO group peptidase (beta-lactamase class C family)